MSGEDWSLSPSSPGPSVHHFSAVSIIVFYPRAGSAAPQATPNSFGHRETKNEPLFYQLQPGKPLGRVLLDPAVWSSVRAMLA